MTRSVLGVERLGMCPFCGLEPMRGMIPEYCEHAVFNWWVDPGAEEGWGDLSDWGDQAVEAAEDLRAALADLLLAVFGAPHPDVAAAGAAGWHTPAEATRRISAVEGEWPEPLPGWWTEIRDRIIEEAEYFDLDPGSGEPTGWTGHFSERLERELLTACVASVEGLTQEDSIFDGLPCGDVFFATDPEGARARIASAIGRTASNLQTAVDRGRGPRL